jgi:hypothetical protein
MTVHPEGIKRFGDHHSWKSLDGTESASKVDRGVEGQVQERRHLGGVWVEREGLSMFESRRSVSLTLPESSCKAGTDLVVALDRGLSVALKLLNHPDTGVRAVAGGVELETTLVRGESLVVSSEQGGEVSVQLDCTLEMLLEKENYFA